jgi:hypothetical protein
MRIGLCKDLPVPLGKARRTDLSRRAGRPDGVIYRQQYIRCGHTRAAAPARHSDPATGRIGMDSTGTTNNARGASTSASNFRAVSSSSLMHRQRPRRRPDQPDLETARRAG